MLFNSREAEYSSTIIYYDVTIGKTASYSVIKVGTFFYISKKIMEQNQSEERGTRNFVLDICDNKENINS